MVHSHHARHSARHPVLWLAMALLVAVVGAPSRASAWWQKDWPYRKQIVIDTTAKGVELHQPVGRAPLLIRLHSGNFKFSDSLETGADIRFIAADDKTPLNAQVESFDPLLGVATIWVDIPQFPTGATKAIWMYYGNKKATAEKASSVFDADYTGVYHFGPGDAAGKDATAYGDNAQGAPPASDEASVIGSGAKFTGQGGMNVPATPSLAVAAGAAFTFSAWVRPDDLQPQAALYSRRDGGGLVIGVEQGVPFMLVNGQHVAAQAALTKGQWAHLAFVADGHNLLLYVNGKPAASAPGALPQMSGPIALGGDAPGGAMPGFTGGMDEVRFSKVARPAALVAMDAASQGAESKLTSFSADEKQSGFGFGYFGIILKSVTVDAWVVIAILGVMAAASWYVMLTKAGYVGAVDKANDRFLERFRAHPEDPLALAYQPEHEAELARSSLYRLYRMGSDDLMRRGKDHGHLNLTAEGMEVIRAIMDAGLVRENQKLSSGLVLLTIAISGGPFLGLLGTVVGVMITFAAIAAAGDVNVNAIAPGISAALLATVAGLGVAIPAMFGYNYILTRNKNVQANMQVFVDEFVTRAAEKYQSHGYARAAE
jgi:biopolymer transport protein ExbB